MNRTLRKSIRLWAEGILLLALRWGQLQTGFDPDTGLSRPSPWGTVLLAAIALIAAAELVCALKLPRGKFSYENTFEPLGQPLLPPLAAGSLLLGVGGVLLPGESALKIAAAAAGIAAAVGLILFAKLLRSGGDGKTYCLLPAMLFSVLLVLTEYLPQDSNPVLAYYYLPVLTSALVACSFYQLAGFPCREASARWFSFLTDLTVPLCVACLADSFGSWGRLMIYTGCALALTPFAAARRSQPVPEPETPDQPEDAANAEQVQD